MERWQAVPVILAEAQARRSVRVDFMLPASLTDGMIRHALVMGAPMAQGVQTRIVRSRGRDTAVTVFLRYREGLRLADEWRRTGCIPEAAAALVAAVRQAQGEAERVRLLCAQLARQIRYAHTAPGRVGYGKLVGAMGALTGGEANCQGFSDACYLIGTLAGLRVRHMIGERNHQQHMWNQVEIAGQWLHVDASRAARADACGETPAAYILRTDEEMRQNGYAWTDIVKQIT